VPLPRPDADPAASAAATGPWVRRGDVGWRVTLDGLVLLPPRRSDPVTVAGSASAVWDLLAEPRSTTELAQCLSDRFGADPATIELDLAPLLVQLLDLGVIVATVQ
jgi:hypothetical protein